MMGKKMNEEEKVHCCKFMRKRYIERREQPWRDEEEIGLMYRSSSSSYCCMSNGEIACSIVDDMMRLSETFSSNKNIM